MKGPSYRASTEHASLIDQPDTSPTSSMSSPDSPTAIISQPASEGGVLSMIERLAANKDFDVDKLRELVALQERILNRNAEAAFNAAFAEMQPEIPEIDEHGRIRNKDGSTRSTFAKLEDIAKVIKPILKRFGFSIRHRTEWPDEKPNIIRVVGILSHREGHSESSVFEAPADKSDYRTDIQSQGSTVSYGRRYTTCDLLNITTRGQDTDGQKQTPDAPDGFEAFGLELESLVPQGINAVTERFAKGPVEFKNYMVQHNKASWDGIKQRAQKATQERQR